MLNVYEIFINVLDYSSREKSRGDPQESAMNFIYLSPWAKEMLAFPRLSFCWEGARWLFSNMKTFILHRPQLDWIHLGHTTLCRPSVHLSFRIWGSEPGFLRYPGGSLEKTLKVPWTFKESLEWQRRRDLNKWDKQDEPASAVPQP